MEINLIQMKQIDIKRKILLTLGTHTHTHTPNYAKTNEVNDVVNF